METKIENNQVTISGEIVSDFEFSHEVFGEKFYTAQLSTKRESGTADTVVIMISDRLIDVSVDWSGQLVKASGQFRSYNRHEGGRNRLILSVFVREIDTLEVTDDINKIFLDGYICKEPIYRKTPFNREIADLLLAVNRPYGKSDYIHCICWGRNARFAERLEVGARLRIEGRIQSREYFKKISEDEYETRTAYEVSIYRMDVVEE